MVRDERDQRPFARTTAKEDQFSKNEFIDLVYYAIFLYIFEGLTFFLPVFVLSLTSLDRLALSIIVSTRSSHL